MVQYADFQTTVELNKGRIWGTAMMQTYLNYFKHVWKFLILKIPYNQSIRRIKQLIKLLKEHSTSFSVQLKETKNKICIIYLLFLLLFRQIRIQSK